MAADHCSPSAAAAPQSGRGSPPPPPPRGPWHSRLSPSLPGSLFSGSPWPPRAGFTCQRRFRPEQKTRPLTASPGARLPWQRRPRGQAASNHSCWIRLVRALTLGAQTQRHPAGAERACASQERPSLGAAATDLPPRPAPRAHRGARASAHPRPPAARPWGASHPQTPESHPDSSSASPISQATFSLCLSVHHLSGSPSACPGSQHRPRLS